MESKAEAFGHPIHPMLIPFPLGLLGTAVIFDVVGTATDRPGLRRAAHPMIGAGIVSGVQTGVVGAIDWAALPAGTRAKRVASQHGLGNLGVLALFSLAWWFRREQPAAKSGAALGLELLGLGGAAITGWLGGELVDRLGVGVHKGAHLNAPSSLSGRSGNVDESRRACGAGR